MSIFTPADMKAMLCIPDGRAHPMPADIKGFIQHAAQAHIGRGLAPIYYVPSAKLYPDETTHKICFASKMTSLQHPFRVFSQPKAPFHGAP